MFKFLWLKVKKACNILLTDGLVVDGLVTFYINSTTGPDTGMTQYNKETFWELIPESTMPAGVGKFTTINTTIFDETFDIAFDTAVSKYVLNSEIKKTQNKEIKGAKQATFYFFWKQQCSQIFLHRI